MECSERPYVVRWAASKLGTLWTIPFARASGRLHRRKGVPAQGFGRIKGMNIFASVGVSVGGRGVTKEGGSYAGGFKLTYLSRGVVLTVYGGGVVFGWWSVSLFF